MKNCEIKATLDYSFVQLKVVINRTSVSLHLELESEVNFLKFALCTSKKHQKKKKKIQQ